MIRRVRLAFVILAAVLLQTTVFTHLRIDDVAPEVGLVCVLAVAYEEGPNTGALFGFCMGLAIDLFLVTPLGLTAMTYAVTGFAVGVFQAGIVRSSPWMPPVLGFLGGLFGGFLFIAIGAMVGQEGFLSAAAIKTVLIAAMLDALIAPIVFPVVRWAAREPEAGGLRDWGTLRGPRRTR
ncbi:MAG: rod shape-determining protein MreD [Acidimicrobiia bacterium]